MLKFRIRPKDNSKIKSFQRLLSQRDIYNKVTPENGLILEINETDSEEVIGLAQKNNIDLIPC